jgi:osmotically-inducible protein OsmY
MRILALGVVFAGALLVLPQISIAAGQQQDTAGALRAKLGKTQFKNLQTSVDEKGIATLSGTVSLYEYKADAEKAAHKVKGVTAVRNQIEVEGPNINDSQLQNKIQEKLAYDRVGYGNEFDAIGVKVQNGVVTMAGHAHDYPSRDSALALVATMPGVKDLVDEVEVDPVSQMDWGIRVAVARAIYGYSSLNKYAIDPAKPIRISVQNGNVALYGEVDSLSDKEVAYLRANGVPGVFSVKNYLQVAGQSGEKTR